MTRIAFIDHHFPYIGIFVVSDVLRLEARGVEVVVFPLKYYHGDRVQAEYLQVRSPVIYIPYIFSRQIWQALGRYVCSRPRRLLRALWRTVRPNLRSGEWLLKTLAILPKALAIAAEIEDRDIRHIHATWAHFPTTAAFLIAELLECSYSFTAHAGMDIYRNQTMLREKIAGARFVTTCATHNRDFLKRAIGEKLASGIHVIHHGIDLRKFSAGQSQPQPGLLLSVGSLNPGKGFIHMIEAAAQLRDDGHRFQYWIAGKGTEEARLRQAIADYNLEGIVEMWGEVDHDKVIDLLRQASVFVLPCVVPANGAIDGIPNALVEALAMRVPAVSTRVSGIPELITDGVTGLLVEPGDVQGLASAVARLLQDDSLREQMVGAGLQRVQRDFDVEKNFLSTFALFESL